MRKKLSVEAKTKLQPLGLVLAIILSLISSCVWFGTHGKRDAIVSDRAVAIDSIAQRYENEFNVVGDLYTPAGDDPNIGFLLPEVEIRSLILCFSQPLEEDTFVAVYYAVNGEGLSENKRVDQIAERGSQKVLIELDRKKYTHIRIDINDRFNLQDILLDDSEPQYSTDVLHEKTDYFCAALVFGGSMVVLLGANILLLWDFSVEKLSFLAVLFMGTVYMMAITPLSVPDEPHHYQSAYELSNYLLFQWNDLEVGDSEDFDYSQFVGHRNVKTGYVRIMEEFFDPDEDGTAISIPTPRSLSFFVEYLPQAIGISFARLTHQNFIRTFIIGRFCNLLFYAICLYIAVKNAPCFKLLLYLVGVMPMALHQAASFSYDAFINGVSMVLIAFSLKCIYEKGPIQKRDYWYLLTAAVFLAPTKCVYIFMTMLVCLIPSERFSTSSQKALVIGSIFAAAAASVILFQFAALFQAADGTADYRVSFKTYSISWALSYPIETIKVFLRSIVHMGPEWIGESMGLRMSGLTITTPEWIIIGYFVLLPLAGMYGEDGAICLRTKDKLLFLFVASFVVIAVMLSMFIGWTNIESPVIQGVQGRYFVPVLPLLFMPLQNRHVKIQRNWVLKICVLSALCFNLSAILNVIESTV